MLHRAEVRFEVTFSGDDIVSYVVGRKRGCGANEDAILGESDEDGWRRGRRLTLGAIIGREDSNEAPILTSVSGFSLLQGYAENCGVGRDTWSCLDGRLVEI